MSDEDTNESGASPQAMGYHEEWPLEPAEGHSSSSNQSDSEEVHQLNLKLVHSQWHNALYRQTLCSVPGGLEAFEEHFQACKEKQKPLICLDCEKDNLLHQLAAVSIRTSPVFCAEIKKNKHRVKRRSQSK